MDNLFSKVKFVKWIKWVGIKNLVVGITKRQYYIRLMQKYGFDVWHLNPIELRKYGQDIVKYVNSRQSVNSVVEVGCGLGDIIRNIQAPQKHGYDLEENVIRVASFLAQKYNDKTVFEVGTFDAICSDNVIDYLIAVNFLHNVPADVVKDYFFAVCKNNTVKNLIVDRVTDPGYLYYHDMKELVPKNYELIFEDTKESYNGHVIEIYSNSLDIIDR